MKNRALILGVHSYVDSNLKVGIQYIAEGLIRYGYNVDYVSIFSSPIDILFSKRRERFKRVWIRRQDKHGIKIKAGLTEYAFRSFFPAHRYLFRHKRQIEACCWLLPSWIRNTKYNICINDVTANVIFLGLIQSKYKVLRLNDLPEGFDYALSKQVINSLQSHIGTNFYDEIWSAHTPLTRYALDLNLNNKAITIPNGVDDSFVRMSNFAVPQKNKSAVFLGSIEQWVDLELLEKTASLLDDWQIDVIGPVNRSLPKKSENIHFLPSIGRELIPKVLSRYTVGLIPFRNISGRLNYVEKPLKFFEYISAGLGVACTDVGSLRAGMGDWASYGNSPESFAGAIREAAITAGKRSSTAVHKLLNDHSWSAMMRIINTRIESLGKHSKN